MCSTAPALNWVCLLKSCSTHTELYPPMSSKFFTYYYPRHTCTHKHLLNSSMEHTNVQCRYTLQGQSVYNQWVSLCIARFSLRLSEPEHNSGTNLAQGLCTKTEHMAGLKPMISWMRVHAPNHLAKGQDPVELKSIYSETWSFSAN